MQPFSGIQELRTPRRNNCPKRIARPEVRFSQIKLKPPANKKELDELTIWGVLAREIDAPDKVKPLVTYVINDPIPQLKPPSLHEAMRMIASLGGFLGRKSDGEPGRKILRIGLQRLNDISAMWQLMLSVPQCRGSTVFSILDMGKGKVNTGE